MKTFIIYYVISGVFTAHYSQRHYDKLLHHYPMLEYFNMNFILFFQFLVGFLIFPLWVTEHIWGVLKRIKNRFDGQQFIPIRALTEEEARKYKEDSDRRIQETLKIHSKYIKDYVDFGNNKIMSVFLYGVPTTMDELKASVVSQFSFSASIEKAFILVNSNYFVVTKEDMLHLLPDWKVACIITNPFFVSNEQQREKI